MTQKEVVDKFLSHTFDTVTSDLRQMMSQESGLDFAIIVLTCAAIELIGILDHGSTKHSSKRFQEAIETYFPERYKKHKATLYDRFRCGLAHQAFIKPGTATTRNPAMREYHLWGIMAGKTEVLFIHPDVFAEDLFAAMRKYRASLNADPSKVDTAHQAIEEVFRNLKKINEPLEMHLSLPDADVDVTRQPIPKYVDKSDVSMGIIAWKEEDTA